MATKKPLLGFLFGVLMLASTSAHRTDWMQKVGWGVAVHYLGPREWTEPYWANHLKNFQVEKLAKQLEDVGAGWLLFTTGQNSNKYAIHNKYLKKKAGSHVHMPPANEKDLIERLYDALNKRGIKLIVYVTSNPPEQVPEVGKALEYEGGPIGKRNKNFMKHWEKAMGEWAKKYGKKAAGFWVDGVYDEKNYKAGYKDQTPSLDSFAKQLRLGNPNAVLSFNDGKGVHSLTINDDLMPGEVFKAEEKLPECKGRWYEKTSSRGKKYKVQWALHTFLACMWAGNGCNPKVPRQFPTSIPGGNAAYHKRVLDAGGVITWDVPIHMFEEGQNGMLFESFIPELRKFKGLKGGHKKSKLSMEPWQTAEYRQNIVRRSEADEDYDNYYYDDEDADDYDYITEEAEEEDVPTRHVQRSGRVLWSYRGFNGPSARSVVAIAEIADSVADNYENADLAPAKTKPLAPGGGMDPMDFAKARTGLGSLDNDDFAFGGPPKFLGGEVFAPNQRALFAGDYDEMEQEF